MIFFSKRAKIIPISFGRKTAKPVKSAPSAENAEWASENKGASSTKWKGHIQKGGSFLVQAAPLFMRYAPLVRPHINVLRSKNQSRKSLVFSALTLGYLAFSAYHKHKNKDNEE